MMPRSMICRRSIFSRSPDSVLRKNKASSATTDEIANRKSHPPAMSSKLPLDSRLIRTHSSWTIMEAMPVISLDRNWGRQIYRNDRKLFAFLQDHETIQFFHDFTRANNVSAKFPGQLVFGKLTHFKSCLGQQQIPGRPFRMTPG